MEHSLIEYIVNALWQVPLIAGAVWLLARLAKPGPRLHHCLWLSALGLALLLPIRGLSNLTAVRPENTAVITNPRVFEREESVAATAVSERPHSTPHWSPRIRKVRLAATSGHWLVRLYLATVLFGLLRIARAWCATRDLVADSLANSRHNDLLATCRERFNGKLPEIRESRQVSSPIVVGITAPVLLLPTGFEQFAPQEIEAALCHELAHIQRWDYAVNIVCQLAALPLVWHPVVHQIQQRIRLTRELVCDAMAAQQMKSEIGYAKCLLALANSMFSARSMHRSAHLVALFTHNNLEERVTQLTETIKMNIGAKITRMAAGGALAIASVALASSFHVTPMMAQSNEPTPFQAQVEPSAPATIPESSTPNLPVVEKQETAPAKRKRAEPGIPQDKSRANMEKADALVDDPDFKELMEKAQRQAARTKAFFETPEFKKQMEDVKKQTADAQREAMKARMFDTPEFKKQMEEVQRQAMKAKAFTETPEFRKQMEDVKKRIADAQQQSMQAKGMIDAPEFRKQLEEAREQASKAREVFDTPEFKQQMENVRKETEKVREILESPEFKERMENLMPRTQSGQAP